MRAGRKGTEVAELYRKTNESCRKKKKNITEEELGERQEYLRL